MKLLGQLTRRRLLGYPSGGKIKYLLRDEFSTDLAAGAVNGTGAEPGIGLRTTVEVDGTISITSGILNLSGQTTVTYGDLGIYFSLPYGRSVGRTVEFRIRRNGDGVCNIGFLDSMAGGLANNMHCFQLSNNGINLRQDPNSNGVGTLAISTWVNLKIVLKATGCDYFINNALVGSGISLTNTPLYVGISDGAMSLDVEYIRVWGGDQPGYLMITFDDGLSSMYDGFSYAISKGVVATSYVITDEIDTAGNLTLTQTQAIDAAGWAIGSHSKDHTNLTTLTEAQQEAELIGAKNALDGWGLTRASRHVSYPNGASNADTINAMVATGMLTGRAVTPAAYANPATTNKYDIRLAYGTVVEASTLLVVQNVIRTGVTGGSWTFLLFHNLYDAPGGGEWTKATFNSLIDWIVAAGVRTRTIVDYYNANISPAVGGVPGYAMGCLGLTYSS